MLIYLLGACAALVVIRRFRKFPCVVSRARFSPLGFAAGSPDAQLRLLHALHWAAPYAPARLSEIGISSEKGTADSPLLGRAVKRPVLATWVGALANRV